jgi:RNA polymerase sigma-70 factor (family 1)
MKIINQDRERIISLQEDNNKAFEYFYDQYRNKVYNFALKLLVDPDLAREIVQQVYIKFWENRSKLDPERPVEPYLYVITRNACFDWLARVNRDRKMKGYFLELNEIRCNETENSTLCQDYKELAARAVAILPGKRRQVFELCHNEGLTYEQIAVKLGISKNTVKTHLLKSYQTIKDYIKKSDITFIFNIFF